MIKPRPSEFPIIVVYHVKIMPYSSNGHNRKMAIGDRLIVSPQPIDSLQPFVNGASRALQGRRVGDVRCYL